MKSQIKRTIASISSLICSSSDSYVSECRPNGGPTPFPSIASLHEQNQNLGGSHHSPTYGAQTSRWAAMQVGMSFISKASYEPVYIPG